MEIKNDLLNFIQKVQSRQINNYRDNKNISTELPQGELKAHDTLELDKFRGQVMSLQKEIGNLQTDISARQAADEYIGSYKGSESPVESLRKFLKDKFSGNEIKLESENSNQIREKLSEEINKIRESISAREVKLQNIFAAGYQVDGGSEHVSIGKNVIANNDTYREMNHGHVENLLKKN